MRASATSFRYRYKLTSLFAVVALTLGLTPALGAQPAAVAGEADGSMAAEGEPLAGLLSSEAEGAGRPHAGAPDDAGEGLAEGAAEEVPLVAASQLSREVALQPLSEGGDVPLLADALAGKPTRFVDQEVSLDGSASVLGSFTVDGMTYAVTGEGAVELVAVAPTFPAGSLAAAPDGGSPGVPSGEDSGSGAPTSPSPSPEGASCDGFGLTALEVLDSVEHDGATYSVTSIGPCALAGCDADVVRIPASVASVDEAAFRGSAVGGVEVAEGNQSLASYEGVLYGADCSDLLLIPEGKEGVVRIPSNTSAIPPDAFSHCASVTAVEVDAGSDAFRSEDGCLYDAEGAMVFGSALMGAEAMERAALPLNNLASAGSARASSTVIHASSQAQCYWFGAPDGVNSIPSNATSFNGPYVANRNESFPDYYTLLANGSWGGSRGSWTIFTQSWAKSTLWFSDSALTKAIPVGAKMSNYFNVYPAAIKSFTVTFKKNEGTGGATSVSVVGGSSIGTIAVPTLSGWTFRGYTDDLGTQSFLYVSASGRGTTRTITSDKTLLANWTKTVSLNANGGTAGSLASLTAGIGRPLGQKCTQVASNSSDYPIRSLFKAGITDKSDWAPTRTGYTFAGYWSTSASTGGTCWITEDGTGKKVTSAIPSTLYARWTPNTYTCTFDKKGGTGGSDTATATYKASLPTVTKPALSGWTFQGYTDDLGTSTYQFVKASGAPTTRTWNYSGDKTLLANWTKTVSLNANGGTAGSLASLTAGIGRPLGQKCTQVASNNSDYPIRSLFKAGITDKSDWAPTRTGYTFAGYWSTSASTGGTCWITEDGTGKEVTSAIPSTLYARWTPNAYTVKFSVNGGAGSGYQTADKTATYGSAMPAISTTKPTRTGYTFMGWYDNADYAAPGAKQYYTDACASARTWDKTATTTLYAGWKAKDYVVTLDDLRGTGASKDVTLTYRKNLPDVQPPTLPGWEFRGYGPNFDASINLWWDKTGHSPYMHTAESTTRVYAHWTKAIALDPNGGSAGSLAQLPAGIGRPLGQKCSPSRDYAMNNELSAFLSVGITDNADWAPTRMGYAFAGYYDTSASTGGTRMVSASGQGSEVAKDTPSTLYARWAPLSYGISYDCAGGELPQGAREGYATGDAFDLPSPVRYGYQFDGWEVAGVAEDGSLGPVQGAGVETATAPDGSKVTRVKAGTYGDLSCMARWTLRYDLDVPVCDPGSVTFEADSLTGQVRVAPGTSAEGAILSYMAVPVALDSLSCEGLDSSGAVDASGDAPELEAIFGAGSAAKVRFTATVGEGEGAATAKVTAGGASGSASLAGLSVPAATSHANPGRIRVSYGLELDPDLPIPPVRDAAPVARLAYTVSLPPAGA